MCSRRQSKSGEYQRTKRQPGYTRTSECPECRAREFQLFLHHIAIQFNAFSSSCPLTAMKFVCNASQVLSETPPFSAPLANRQMSSQSMSRQHNHIRRIPPASVEGSHRVIIQHQTMAPVDESESRRRNITPTEEGRFGTYPLQRNSRPSIEVQPGGGERQRMPDPNAAEARSAVGQRFEASSREISAGARQKNLPARRASRK